MEALPIYVYLQKLTERQHYSKKKPIIKVFVNFIVEINIKSSVLPRLEAAPLKRSYLICFQLWGTPFWKKLEKYHDLNYLKNCNALVFTSYLIFITHQSIQSVFFLFQQCSLRLGVLIKMKFLRSAVLAFSWIIFVSLDLLTFS